VLKNSAPFAATASEMMVWPWRRGGRDRFPRALFSPEVTVGNVNKGVGDSTRDMTCNNVDMLGFPTSLCP